MREQTGEGRGREVNRTCAVHQLAVGWRPGVEHDLRPALVAQESHLEMGAQQGTAGRLFGEGVQGAAAQEKYWYW